MLWLYLDFYQLTLDMLAPIQTELRVQPCIIYRADTNQVLQCNALAHAAGIESGMGMAQAASLSGELNIIDYKEQREANHLTVLASALYPLIGDIVLAPPNSLALRLDPSIKYYEGLQPLWQTIINELTRQKVTYRFATGWSIESAKVLAKAKTNTIIAKRTDIHHALQQCHLKHTDLSTKQITSLSRVGIHNIKSLLALPATELGKRFDNALISYLTALRGEVFPHCSYFHPEETFSATIEPAYEISQTQHLIPWVNRLLNQLATFLRLRNQLTASLTLTLYFRETEKQIYQVGSACPLSKASNWEPLFVLLIEKLTLSHPVTAIGLCTNATEEISDQSSDFFSDRVHYFAKMQLLGRLQAKLGASNICQPASINDHRLGQLAHTQASAMLSEPCAWQPLFIASQPVLLTQPSHIQFGPVRLQTGWWDGESVKRDYFITQTARGEYALVYKSPPAEQWYIEGWYG
ncbi:Y-family DNA polymerase [Alteromonas ponticola]|uniref:DNA polymerase Y family protein n=1 Tax=Alteromonas ponticola TaxID=2720613 RepID=A0ABX1R2D3_9ALTE|nr:DNA polymerase Y family protein [Alteromonas ponticola]NMH59791.1 DNA polymerase Y family protein [Alteromonas ponticola]